MKYTASIKGFDDFEPKETNDIKLTQIDKTNYIVHLDGQNYNAFLLESNLKNKQFQFNINGRIIDIEMHDELDVLIKEMEFDKGDKTAKKELLSPMPGIILTVDVKVGDEIKEGDKLFTLEAMKMENIIKASTDGIVGSIEIEVNTAVDKNQLLLKFE